jgi:hypothetical protein
MATGRPVPFLIRSYSTPPYANTRSFTGKLIRLFTTLRCRKHGRANGTVSLSPYLRRVLAYGIQYHLKILPSCLFLFDITGLSGGALVLRRVVSSWPQVALYHFLFDLFLYREAVATGRPVPRLLNRLLTHRPPEASFRVDLRDMGAFDGLHWIDDTIILRTCFFQIFFFKVMDD